MSGVSLTLQEKRSIPKLHLKTKTDELNKYVINTHKELNREKKLEEKKIVEVLLEKKKKAQEFKKSFNELVKPKNRFKPVNEKESKEECTTRELGRVMTFLKDVNINNDWINQKSIQTGTGLSNNNVIDALKFLTKFGIAEEKMDEKRYFYYKLK